MWDKVKKLSIVLEICLIAESLQNRLKEDKYSRTSMARTLMARLPWLFQTRACVPRKQEGHEALNRSPEYTG